MAWQPGDAPHTHPLWAEQVELELEMMNAGRDAYLVKVGKVRDKEEMTTLKPFRRMMESMTEDMGRGVKHWLNETAKTRRSGNMAAAAYHRIREIDPLVAAYVTIRTILDGMSLGTNGKPQGTLTVAEKIGLSLDHEARMAAWFALEPKLFDGHLVKDRKGNRKQFISVQKQLKVQKATDTHKRRVNIHRFNTLMREKLDWRDWSAAERRTVGLKLLDIACTTTGHFQLQEEKDAVRRKSVHKGRSVLVPSEELSTHLMEALELDESRTPHYMPTLMPPKRWESMRTGGYYTPAVRAPNLIRFKVDHEEVRGAAMEEYDALDMPRVMEAIAKVQEVPYMINERVLEVVHSAWERNLGIAGLTKREPSPMPQRPAGMHRLDLEGSPNRRAIERTWMEEHEAETREWKQAAAKVYGANARRLSNSQAITTTLKLADRFVGRQFYFPHMLDFRGRMYPIPAYLQPQGGDLARGLLTFAKGRPVSLKDGSSAWLAVHLANVWGVDKVSFEDRIGWVEDTQDLWLRIAENPLGNLEWTHQTDDCWQSLAAIFEWTRYLKEGDGMTSALPVRVDGTCNGIQHLSAMMRDKVGGASVNLMAGDKPRDIYKEVANQLKDKLEGIEGSGGSPGYNAAVWMNGLERDIPRTLTKNPVMVLPYGGTKESYYNSIHKWLGKNDPEHDAIDKEDLKEAVPFLVGHLWDSVTVTLPRAIECMEWLKACAKIVSDIDLPIFWTTKAGFHVRHFYGKLEATRVATRIDGKAVTFVSMDRSKKLSKKDQLQGISPNFVHSQDAAVNMETILDFMQGDEPAPFTTIHDAFGTVAGCMWQLHGCIREAFIKVHSDDVLAHFRLRCVLMLRDHLYVMGKGDLEQAWEEAENTIPKLPEKGDLDLEEVRNADYFFA